MFFEEERQLNFADYLTSQDKVMEKTRELSHEEQPVKKVSEYIMKSLSDWDCLPQNVKDIKL